MNQEFIQDLNSYPVRKNYIYIEREHNFNALFLFLKLRFDTNTTKC